MNDNECIIRYEEKSTIGELSTKTVLYFWDDKLDVFQTLSVGEWDEKSIISFTKETAVRYAKMILDKYEGVE